MSPSPKPNSPTWALRVGRKAPRCPSDISARLRSGRVRVPQLDDLARKGRRLSPNRVDTRRPTRGAATYMSKQLIEKTGLNNPKAFLGSAIFKQALVRPAGVQPDDGGNHRRAEVKRIEQPADNDLPMTLIRRHRWLQVLILLAPAAIWAGLLHRLSGVRGGEDEPLADGVLPPGVQVDARKLSHHLLQLALHRRARALGQTRSDRRRALRLVQPAARALHLLPRQARPVRLVRRRRGRAVARLPAVHRRLAHAAR